jgi:type VI secretion system protein ImpF
VARAKPEEVIRPSVFDRLIGDVPKKVPGPQLQVGVRELKRAVARDLEWLLNTHHWFPRDLDASEEMRDSILNYGLPDISSYSWRSDHDARAICRRLEQIVKNFEPRLLPRSISVEVLEAGETDDFKLRFRIDAILHVEPIHEPVSFDTNVELDTNTMHVERVT